MKTKYFLMFCILVLTIVKANSQTQDADSAYKKFFKGSTFFILGNFASSNKPDFVQLNLGYRLKPKNAVSIELKTWKYAWSLGIPHGGSFEAPQKKFPGYIREYGFASVYQHF